MKNLLLSLTLVLLGARSTFSQTRPVDSPLGDRKSFYNDLINQIVYEMILFDKYDCNNSERKVFKTKRKVHNILPQTHKISVYDNELKRTFDLEFCFLNDTYLGVFFVTDKSRPEFQITFWYRGYSIPEYCHIAPDDSFYTLDDKQSFYPKILHILFLTRSTMQKNDIPNNVTSKN